MYYVTGDIHGNQKKWDARDASSLLKKGDVLIVTGDFGIGFFDGEKLSEGMFLDRLEEKDYTIAFIDGNHENFELLNRYPVSEWNGGKVHFVRRNVIHLMRGEIFDIEGGSLFAMGGGYSVDKSIRVLGTSWWLEEMPNENEYRNASENLKRTGFKVDYILTHTAPVDTVNYMAHMGRGIKNNVTEEAPLTGFLQWIEDVTDYRKWYFGHFHFESELPKNQYVIYEGIRNLHTGELVS